MRFDRSAITVTSVFDSSTGLGSGMGLGIAIKAFCAALFDKQKSALIERLLAGEAAISSTRAEPVAQSPGQRVSPPARDSAVTLLATLQREARLVDLIHEELGKYSDAQVGAAARPCLQQCAAALHRLFDLQPLLVAAEGDLVDVADEASPMRYQWVGEGTAAAGKLIHHGWQVTKIELPKWTGDAADANVITPAQVQAP